MASMDLSRRSVLLAGAAMAAGGAMSVLPGVAFGVPASGTSTQTRTVSGTSAPDIPDWYYLPVEVPAGVNRIDVSYGYDKPSVPGGVRGNALDIGMFGPEGIDLGNQRGFRGWSGGFRTSFTISASDATPGSSPAGSPRAPGT